MIIIKRLAEPSSLRQNWRKWNIDYAKAITVKEKERLSSRYRKKDVQTQLNLMFNGKCAYCESVIGIVDYGHIEHFRPKHMFPKRIYLWRNLLLSCSKCNGAEYKGMKFPSKAEGGPLLSPCTDDPSQHFSFDYNPQTREARISPLTRRGEITEKTLGLNRSSLLAARSNLLRQLVFIRTRADTDQEARDLISKALDPSGPYLAFLRKYITIPSP